MREERTGLALVAPAIAIVAVFVLFPLGFCVYISLTNWPLVGPYHFVGLANYRALVHDSTFLQSVTFTLKYTGIVTLPILVIGYLLAVFVRGNRFGATLFRTCIFLPFIVGITTLSFLAEVELQPGFGSVNVLLSKLHLASLQTVWVQNSTLALVAISVLVVWLASGLTMMLLMAGMQGIPDELYESANVDGASWWEKERFVTIPLLRRSIALSLIISVVGSFLAFNQFFIITDGGPGTSTVSVVMEIYETFNTAMRVGGASAMAVVLVVVVGLITFVQFKVLRGGDA
ncbi:MAG: sugar ABC transporter permease [Actinomycetota bacterium]|nr:sugar ABC transporter permease [Actinomycetota bacterium]